MEIVAADIGGTNARFAIAEVANGKVISLGQAVTIKTAEHASLQTAWEAFAREIGRRLPQAASLAVACPVAGEVLQLTNNPWIIRPALITSKLGLERFSLVNDFGAVGHAVAQLGPNYFQHLQGPDIPLPEDGVIGIVGPGTGLGVAQILRQGGTYQVVETEGGHIDFAPLNVLEDKILLHLRQRYRRVSIERIVSGPGLRNIYEALGAIEGRQIHADDDTALWTTAFEGTDSLATAALDRFCLSLGSIAGDIALVQGASAIVIAGGLGQKLARVLSRSGFSSRFIAKGRFERRMAAIPVKLVMHPQPGLFGAAAAFAKEYAQ